MKKHYYILHLFNKIGATNLAYFVQDCKDADIDKMNNDGFESELVMFDSFEGIIFFCENNI